MAVATTHDVVVHRPPTPHLGNFSEVFDAFMKLQAGTDFKNPKLERKPSTKELAKEAVKQKARVKNELLGTPDPCAVAIQAIRALRTPRITLGGKYVSENVSETSSVAATKPVTLNMAESILSASISAGITASLVDITSAAKHDEPTSAPAGAVDQSAAIVQPAVVIQPATIDQRVAIDRRVTFESPSNDNGSETTLNSVSAGSIPHSANTTSPSGSENNQASASTTPPTVVLDSAPLTFNLRGNATDPDYQGYHSLGDGLPSVRAFPQGNPFPTQKPLELPVTTPYGPRPYVDRTGPQAKADLAATAAKPTEVDLAEGAKRFYSFLQSRQAQLAALPTPPVVPAFVPAPAPALPSNEFSEIMKTIKKVPWFPINSRFKLQGPEEPCEGVKLFWVVGGKSQDGLTPTYMCTQEDKARFLSHKLKTIVTKDHELKQDLPAASNPIHVFVDLSNITIGFYDALKLRLGVPPTRRVKAPPFSFEQLACVLERGRSAEKRVVAGSVVNAYNRKWPEYMEEANKLGYEMNILQRVPKAVIDLTHKKAGARRAAGEAGWTTSGAESSSDDACFDGQLKQGEQGVDEILHLKMLQSVLDAKPGTAVLATGDAAEAEYSDGFKKNVERLLQNGWNVEIVGWAKGISWAWRDPSFAKAWGDRFRVIELDEYVEELFDAWIGAPGF